MNARLIIHLQKHARIKQMVHRVLTDYVKTVHVQMILVQVVQLKRVHRVQQIK